MKQIIGTVALAAALLLLHIPSGHAAYGDAPWCAVINVGTGEMYWDCQYQTFEACAPNVIAGNRGFCNVNPTYTPAAAPLATHYAPHHPSMHHGSTHHVSMRHVSKRHVSKHHVSKHHVSKHHTSKHHVSKRSHTG